MLSTCTKWANLCVCVLFAVALATCVIICRLLRSTRGGWASETPRPERSRCPGMVSRCNPQTRKCDVCRENPSCDLLKPINQQSWRRKRFCRMWTPSCCRRWWRWGAGDAFANTWSSGQFRWKPIPPDTENKGEGLAGHRPVLAKTHSFDYNVHAHTFLLRVFGWFLLFGNNGWRCRLIPLNCNVISKMCIFQKEAASAGERTF